jgi:hypothetical protein
MEKTHLDICNETYKPGMEIKSAYGGTFTIKDVPFRYGLFKKGEHVYANDGDVCLYNPFDASYAKIVLSIPEEWDWSTKEGRLAYAVKHYPIGTVIKSIHHDEVYKLTSEPRNYMKTTIVADSHGVVPDIYHAGKWAEIVEKGKEEIKVMKTQQLSRAGLKEIHSVACSNWKAVLERYGANSPLEDYIELTQEQVDNMFKACTATQLPIVSKYLKQDDGSVNIKKLDFNDNYLISRRNNGEYKNKAFWLTTDYDWILNFDNEGELCLIPTKKK